MNNYLEKKENSNSNEYRPASLTYVETCFVVSVYSFMFFMSFVGNSVILLIICKKRRRTVNNLFLANMIISNLIYTLFAPFTFVTEIMNNESEWIFPDFLCPCLSYLNELSVNLNTLTMCVSSVERLIAFICPLKSKLPKKVCYLVIALIWTLSISLALPWTILMKIEQLYAFSHDVSIDEAKETPDMIKVCIASDSHNKTMRIYFIFLNIVQFVLPMFALIITYSIITYRLRYLNAKEGKKDENKQNNVVRKKREKKV